METTNTDIKNRISNERIYLPPNSVIAFLLEKELIDRDIQYYKDYGMVRHSYVVFTFLEKDIPIIHEIYDRIAQRLEKQDELNKKKKKVAKRTIEYRQKRIAILLLLLIVIIVIIGLFG